MDNHGYVPDEANGRAYTISRSNSSTKPINSNAFLVGVNSRFKSPKKPVYYRRAAIILTVIVIILLIGLIVLIALHKRQNSAKLCTTSQCIRSAANLKYSMNFSVNPCDDFYKFCCGRWSKEHPNHGWYPSYSTFTTISEKIMIESMEVLQGDLEDDEPAAVGHAKRLYQSCMDKESTDDLGLTPLVKYLNMTGLPTIPSYFNTILTKDFQFDWVRTEVLLKVVLAMDVFIGFTVQPNIFKRNESVIYVGVLYQSCPLPSPMKKKHLKLRQPWKRPITKRETDDDADPDSDSDDDQVEHQRKELRTKIRTTIIKYVTKRLFEYSGLTHPEEEFLQEAADIINNITYHLDDLNENENYTLPQGDTGEDQTHNVTFKKLQELTDNNVEKLMPDFWINYISLIFEGTNVTINESSDYLFITDVELGYIWGVLNYVSSLPREHIELYMWWSTVYAMILSTTSEVSEYILAATAVYYASTYQDDESVYVRSRSLDCCELVNKYMGWAVSYAIADKNFANRTKPRVKKMINDIKAAFVEHVRGITWMDDATKKVTLQKSEEMLSLVGYPDWLYEPGALDRKYYGLEINETTYLDNLVNIIIQSINETLTSLRLTNPRDWSTEATTVNAFNSFSDNAINVPMAILNYPLYDLGLEVLNYGSIGSILGHELTHGFDNTGRKYDIYGNYIQWWTNKTIDTFENMTKCFVDQYDNYTLDGVKGHVKGRVTLGENLADNGGVNQAYMAYKRYRKKYGEEAKLPGFEGYSSDQMFYIAYGSIWCETTSVDDLKLQLEYDEHCPNAIRVIGTLQNSEEFSEAFSCPVDSYMNPKRKKCKIW
ncbi:neprilysin isoform X2 [Anthonomus grandis grandis]|uniref:neprilysin isoform X2 n=1 Tax=Anthonomus grandis grandis TaxID=2921223 RepID=UPI0021652128|nr:neprilysin isoform X2 [Anthonomus grandis grandis]